MTCARGCCDTQADHYKSLRILSPDRKQWRKTTTDVHDRHTVDVTEHYSGDRQDVTVNNPPVIRANAREFRSGE